MSEETIDWRHRAACLSEDPELFFPIGNTGPAALQIEEAKYVCRRCNVREQCLQWALEYPEDHGVWGGLSEDERRALNRRRVSPAERRRRQREAAEEAEREEELRKQTATEAAQAAVDNAYDAHDDESLSFALD